MKNKIILFTALNMAVLLILMSFSFWQYMQAEKICARDVVSVVPKRNEPVYFFSLNDIGIMQKKYPRCTIAYEYKQKAVVQVELKKAETTAYCVNAEFFQLNNISFLQGSSWLGRQGNGIVLNEQLAWELFGNGYAVGQSVLVDGLYYTVAGIVSQKDGASAIWIPFSGGEFEPLIQNIFIRFADYNFLSASTQINNMLTGVYHNSGDYYVTDINVYVSKFLFRIKIFLIAVWLAVFIQLILPSTWHSLFKNKNRLGKFIYILFVAASLYALSGVSGLITEITGVIDITPLYMQMLNMGTFPAAEYLPYGMQVLSLLNLHQNIALAAGLFVLLNLIFWTWDGRFGKSS